ncbi:hypothetical protein ACFLRQ_01715 [Bacteroidota bacterium]
MKASNETKQTRRVLTTGIMLIMIFSMSNAQGLLAEGATKLFKSLFTIEVKNSPILFTTDYSLTDNTRSRSLIYNGLVDLMNNSDESYELSVAVEEFTPRSIKSFKVQSVNVSYENELETENWMSESFSESFESSIETESWMTESFSESFESELMREDWMSESFYDGMESTIEVENWMVQPFSEGFSEERIEVESWMTTPLYTLAEDEIEVEDWMIQSLR